MRRRVRGILMSGKQFSLDSHMDVVVQTTLDAGTGTTNSYGRAAVRDSTAQGATGNQASIREDNEESPEGMKPR